MNSKRLFVEFYRDHGLPEHLVASYSEYASNLYDQDLPVIFEVNHLALRTGLTRRFLGVAINSPEHLYRSFSLKKKLGGSRNITAPYPSLLHAQKWIKRSILEKIPVSSASTAYGKGCSVRKNAQQHSGESVVLCMDLENFFPSIQKEKVIKVFRSLGYSSKISYYLASICCYENALPQGAPTSPDLSNIICRNLDNRLLGLSAKSGLNYTRYADDLCFSGSNISNSLVSSIKNIISDVGFSVNNKKTRRMVSANRKVVTGINVVNHNLSLSKSYKRDIEKEVYYIKRFGLHSHLRKRKIRDPAYLNRLIGKAQYWHNIESWNTRSRNILNYLIALKFEM